MDVKRGKGGGTRRTGGIQKTHVGECETTGDTPEEDPDRSKWRRREGIEEAAA